MFDLDKLLKLVEQMCALGFENKAEFDGWGARVQDVKKTKRAWWKFC